MSQDRLDMTGLWHGTFSYPAFEGPTTPFVANLHDADGRLSGSILEPDAQGFGGFPGGELEAQIVGTRAGQAVDFIKTYGGPIAGHCVDYVGKLTDDGQTVTGVWSYDELDGAFEMHRDISLEEVIAAETEAEIELPR